MASLQRVFGKNAAYLLIGPAAIWLALFFLFPMLSLLTTSLSDPAGNPITGYDLTWRIQNYLEALGDYWPYLLRSLLYAGIATVLCLVLGYVLAYAIAFKAGRWKTVMLVLVIAPFFTSFLVRTLSWKLILADNGWLVETLKALWILPEDGRLLATPIAVVAGLTYNFLPFMILPLYTSLEKIDPKLNEAAADLYASPFQRFAKVIWPLSLPGVVGGTLLTFIPATGDYINAELLGSPNTQMVGNKIQALFTTASDYPHASALSVILMVMIVAMVLYYVRKAGTEDLL
ncbi:ABC transporter permease [Demequina sp. SYSU T00039]|uniref:ABC transporter permease n=1 Tax=Demequina lignilytica TaxID=3051663 RepID=A0AAW7M4T1_9MICO|nr:MULTISPECIES: ABC transporter permease [unclassified Demequina]MDN4478065.1 ABC transporter permease [Demequina sp. SYSU T00039-1]MDN4488485.1 ABC transporter permease [Demequina sp. SYSU T00039]MDN4489968.1 ABC transporter permease [Demequina sp. SYSU T00068]